VQSRIVVSGGWTEPVQEAPGFTRSSLQPPATLAISQHSVTTPQSSCGTGKSRRSVGGWRHLSRASRQSMCAAGLSVWPEPADRRQLRTRADTYLMTTYGVSCRYDGRGFADLARPSENNGHTACEAPSSVLLFSRQASRNRAIAKKLVFR
jgi:hypothetical protein